MTAEARGVCGVNTASFPPGDIRNCMVALSQDEALLGRLFQYRFHSGRGLRGHSFGNLFLTALTHVTEILPKPLKSVVKCLRIRGRIFPATLENVTLEAVMSDGKVVAGETRIPKSGKKIRRLRLRPRHVRPFPEVLEAIARADLNLDWVPDRCIQVSCRIFLVSGVAEAIESFLRHEVYIANLMTPSPGETEGFSLSDHVRTINEHTRRQAIRLASWQQSKSSRRKSRGRYSAAQSRAGAAVDIGELHAIGVRCLLDDLLDEHVVVRHDAARLSKLLIEEFRRAQTRRG